jgi:hypothetical protein
MATLEWFKWLPATFVKLAEELDIVQTQAVDGWAECAQNEIEGVDKQSDHDTDDNAAHHPNYIVGQASKKHRCQSDSRNPSIRKHVAN